jgi:hypothetical protein
MRFRVLAMALLGAVAAGASPAGAALDSTTAAAYLARTGH